ncbi:hypothetical protein GJ688_02495 [Heliobacillus mobilis]|uniref:Uncharacterized protein n=1 Tax=Heliobacterium mobile TaxID=28064 RepID=A0A6I3SCF4_HELMO|nr:hypothetical protein [Heliobacterium mobile]MTV47853.1 hypothetical protein [Heliobacterium mobile]
MNVTAEGIWFIEYEDGTVHGPLHNLITQAGLGLIASSISNLSSPYLLVGDDNSPGETITEIFRKPVSSVTCTAGEVRFRTQLVPADCNGNHNKMAIVIGGTDVAGTGTMLNLLTQPWSKNGNTVLTIEARITITGN